LTLAQEGVLRLSFTILKNKSDPGTLLALPLFFA
jgi:hypothetical protein